MLRAASVVALAAASLAGKHDAVRRRLSQTPDGCALYIAGPVIASKGNQVATVDSLQNYELTFTMELASDWSITGEWQSILHIGEVSNNDHRLPGLWFHKTLNALYVLQSSVSGKENYIESTSTGVTFTAGETHDIKVVVQSNQMTVYVGDISVGTATGSATYVATDSAVWVGDPWYDAAKVTLSDITLSEIALADTCRENILATTAPTITPTTTPGTGYIFQAGRCYPQSEAPVINTAGLMSSTLRRTGTPQECYDYCTDNSGFNIMGLDLRPTGGQDCQCKVAEDDYNDGRDCKRLAGTSTAIEDMDWSSMAEDYVCFTETFDADAELSELCDDGESDAAGSSSSNDKDSDNEGHLLMILIILPTLLLAVIAWAILVMIKRHKLASICDRLRRPSAAAPPAHEPTPLSPSALASIEASNLKMMGMMSEEPRAAEAILPHGHVSGAEAAAAMAAGEPPPPPAAEAYATEAEFELEP